VNCSPQVDGMERQRILQLLLLLPLLHFLCLQPSGQQMQLELEEKQLFVAGAVYADVAVAASVAVSVSVVGGDNADNYHLRSW